MVLKVWKCLVCTKGKIGTKKGHRGNMLGFFFKWSNKGCWGDVRDDMGELQKDIEDTLGDVG